MFLFLILL